MSFALVSVFVTADFYRKKKKQKKNIPLMLTAVNIKTKYSEELSNCCFEKQLL